MPAIKGSHPLPDMVAFDVETPNCKNDRISEIGLVLISGEEIVGTFDYIINPEVPFDELNTELTGISEETVADSPIFPDAWPEIEKIIQGRTLVAHNAVFDLSVLSKTLCAYEIPAPPLIYVCTLALARRTLPDLPHHGLYDLCSYYQINLNHHKACSDAIACAEIMLELHKSGANPAEIMREYVPGKNKSGASSPKPKGRQVSLRDRKPSISMDIANKSICLTGEFVCAGRTELSGYLAQMGAIVQKGVTRKTDYLIVGRNGSDLWSEKTCGTKEKRARELQEQGFPIQIISESDLFIEEGVPV